MSERNWDADWALCEAATPGPWVPAIDGHGIISGVMPDLNVIHDGCIFFAHSEENPNFKNDCHFIAEARSALPYWLQRVKKLTEEIEELKRRLRAAEERTEKAEAELRRWFGCPACGEDHPPDTMCPPHEVRSNGLDWFYGRIRKMRAELEALETENAQLRAVVEAAKKLRALHVFDNVRGLDEDFWEEHFNAEDTLYAAVDALEEANRDV